ncbi:hypothetical protein GJ496_007647 [Pomphorhynchus laevis]|nr:hypothetical protein GJ496_007647 [Pomphorhynchus laevis]
MLLKDTLLRVLKASSWCKTKSKVVGLVRLNSRNVIFIDGSGKEAKPKLIITQGMPKEIINRLSPNFDIYHHNSEMPIRTADFLREVKGATAVYTLLNTKIDKEVLDTAGPSLKVVATMSVGYDHIDVAECRKRGIILGYTPGVLTDATADTNIMLMLATSRRLIESANAVRNGEWGTWKPFWMCGQGIKDHTVGIIGMGRIGKAVGERLRPFNPKKILYSVGPNTEQPPSWSKSARLDSILRSADFVTITCDLTPETKNMFNKDTFKQMKRNSILVNTSRGPIVNMDDLYNALKKGHIAGAGLDVTVPEPLPTDHKLLSLNNCVILPHIGSADVQTRMGMANLTVDNILAWATGKKLPAEIPY